MVGKHGRQVLSPSSQHRLYMCRLLEFKTAWHNLFMVKQVPAADRMSMIYTAAIDAVCVYTYRFYLSGCG